jgi:hypothetical protein
MVSPLFLTLIARESIHYPRHPQPHPCQNDKFARISVVLPEVRWTVQPSPTLWRRVCGERVEYEHVGGLVARLPSGIWGKASGGKSGPPESDDLFVI